MLHLLKLRGKSGALNTTLTKETTPFDPVHEQLVKIVKGDLVGIARYPTSVVRSEDLIFEPAEGEVTIHAHGAACQADFTGDTTFVAAVDDNKNQIHSWNVITPTEYVYPPSFFDSIAGPQTGRVSFIDRQLSFYDHLCIECSSFFNGNIYLKTAWNGIPLYTETVLAQPRKTRSITSMKKLAAIYIKRLTPQLVQEQVNVLDSVPAPPASAVKPKFDHHRGMGRIYHRLIRKDYDSLLEMVQELNTIMWGYDYPITRKKLYKIQQQLIGNRRKAKNRHVWSLATTRKELKPMLETLHGCNDG